MTIKTSAVAGTFYPNDQTQLASLINQLLLDNPCVGEQPNALIVPHAAPVYSGKIADLAYNLLKPYIHFYKRLIILGPAHRVAFDYHAALDAQTWQTPLGSINIDKQYTDELIEKGHASYFNQAHSQEHSIEVQLPFLQCTGLDELPIVPIVVGQAANDKTSALVDYLLADSDNFVIISSDMSHFKNYQQAIDFDAETIQSISQMTPFLRSEQACGCYPINALLTCDAQQSLQAKVLGYCNSGDTGGDKNRVVGYAAFAFHPKFSDARKQQMLAMARNEISKALIDQNSDETCDHKLDSSAPKDYYLQENLACFVTLNTVDMNNTDHKTLRGCIGNLQPNGTLLESIKRNAILAAFKDPRFSPVTESELEAITIEISILTPAKPMSVSTHKDLINQLQPYRDGLILKYRNSSATFLPSVWEQLPDPQQFVEHLKVKAGLDQNFWAAEMQCFRYQAIKFSESD